MRNACKLLFTAMMVFLLSCPAAYAQEQQDTLPVQNIDVAEDMDASQKFKTKETGHVAIIERPAEEFLILGVVVNGTVRDEGMEAYLPEAYGYEEVLVPLGALARLLSIAIEVEPYDGYAEGFYLEEDNSFQLDLRRGQVIIGDDEIALESGDTEAHSDDIYVQAEALNRWFDLDISLDLNSLLLDINADRTFPFQEREQRRRRAEAYKSRVTSEVISPENARFLPYQAFSFPSLLMQQSFIASDNAGDRAINGVSSIQGNMDLAYFNANMILSRRMNTDGVNEVTNAELFFQRRDPKQQMLGPLKAGRVAFGDVDFPSVPLFAGKKRGRGVNISSNSNLGFEYARQNEGFFLEGEAPIGWDAELYRNNIFFDFQQVGNDGKFRFEDLDLISGFNLFQIILYGPEGQKQVVTREVYRGPNMLEEGEHYYDISAGQPLADFLPIAEGKREDDRLGASAQGLYGLSENLTIGASLFRGPEGEDESSAGTLTAATSFLGLSNQLQLMLADDSRRAYEVMSRARVKGLNISFLYTDYEGFDEDDQPLDKQSELSLSRSFGGFNVSLKASKRDFLSGENDVLLENIISAKIWDISIVNDLEKVFADNPSAERFDGNLSLLTNIGDIRLRGSFVYDLDSDAVERLTSANLTAQKNFDNRSSVRLGMNHQFAANVTSGDVRYSRYFGPVSVDFSVSANTEDNYSAGVTLRSALQSDHRGSYEVVDSKTGGQAVLGVRAFIDDNLNNAYDDGEEILPDIGFKANRGGIKGISGEEGVAWMNGFVEQPTRIRVDQGTVQSIYIEAKNPSLDIIPRRGSNAILDFAFVRLGEMDGFVQTLSGEALSNVPVQLIDPATGAIIEETESEYDGYFIFTALPIGDYALRAYVDWVEPEIEARKNISLSAVQSAVLDIELRLDMPQAQAGLDVQNPEEIEPSAGSMAYDKYVHLGSYANEAVLKTMIKALQTASFNVVTRIVPVQVNGKTLHRLLLKKPVQLTRKAFCVEIKAGAYSNYCR